MNTRTRTHFIHICPPCFDSGERHFFSFSFLYSRRERRDDFFFVGAGGRGERKVALATKHIFLGRGSFDNFTLYLLPMLHFHISSAFFFM